MNILYSILILRAFQKSVMFNWKWPAHSEELYLFDQIENDQSARLVKAILHGRGPLKLYINSSGGVIGDAFAIIDAMMVSKRSIHTIVMGHADSSAAMIALAGTRRSITANASMYFHNIATYQSRIWPLKSGFKPVAATNFWQTQMCKIFNERVPQETTWAKVMDKRLSADMCVKMGVVEDVM